MNSLVAERLGAQTPRVLVAPQGTVNSSGEFAAELIGLAGVKLDVWQRSILDLALGERADGSWAAKTVDIVCSRQNGKNVVLEARELFGAIVLGEYVMHTAHEFKTARKSFKRIKDLLKKHPDLQEKLVQKYESPMSGYSFEFVGGGFIEFIARSGGSGRGFTGDLLILDEAQDLSDDALGALLPALSATSIEGDPQVWYTGSAPGEKSIVWHRRRKAGRAGGLPTSAYFEYSADPDLTDLNDRDAWAQANPGLGIRIAESFIEETERGSMSDEMFARERLSISDDLPDEDSDRVIPKAVWNACKDEKSGPVGQVSFALDVRPERDWSSIATVADGPPILNPNGDIERETVHLEIVDRRPGTGWLVSRALELQEKWGGLLAVSAGSPAASLLDDLAAAGVNVVEVSNADHAVACGQLFDAITEGRVKHLGQPELDAAAAGADRKFTGDAWLWSRRLSQVDITPLVAVTLAKWLHDQRPAVAPFVMVG